METEIPEINNNNQDWKPSVIVLGPGGVKGYLELGALLVFEKEDYFDSVNYWTGCSIGSAIALLVVCGYTIEEIVDDFINFNILNEFIGINIGNILDKAGLIKNETMEKLLTLRISQKFGFIPTLKQLYLSTNIILTTTVYNTDKTRTEYFNKDTEPDISCIEAAMISMAMPIIIESRIHNGSEYIDGAIGDPYPVLIHDNGQRDILGIYIDSESSSIKNINIPNIIYKGFEAIQGSIKTRRDQNIEWASNKCKHVELKSNIQDSVGLTVDENTRKLMVKQGYESALLFLDKMKNPNRYNLLLGDDEEISTIEDLLDQHKIDEEMVKILKGTSKTNKTNKTNKNSNDNTDDNTNNNNINMKTIEEHFNFNTSSYSNDEDEDNTSDDNEILLVSLTPEIMDNMNNIRITK